MGVKLKMLSLHRRFGIPFFCAIFLLSLNMAYLMSVSASSYKFLSAIPLIMSMMFVTKNLKSGFRGDRYLFYRVLWAVLLLAQLFDLYNKTHLGAMILLLHFYFRERLYFGISLFVLAYVEAKVTFGCMGLIIIHALFVQKRFIQLFSVLIILSVIMFNIVGHWLQYDLEKIWTIQNRLNSYEFLFEYLFSGDYDFWFGSNPGLYISYSDAFDAGLVVGVIRLGLPLFLCYAIIFFLILKHHVKSNILATIGMVPLITQSYILQPVVVLFFCALVIFNRDHSFDR